MSKQEIKTAVGKLIAAGREGMGMKRPAFVKVLDGALQLSALKNIENGVSYPSKVSAGKLETALHWRHGVLYELWERGLEGEDLSHVTLEDVADAWASEPVTRAVFLDDTELLVEVIRRMERWQARLAPDEDASQPVTEVRGKRTPAQERWESFGLAARQDMEPTNE